MISLTATLCGQPEDSWVSPRKDVTMIRQLLCRWGIGHHWLAQMNDGEFRRRCIHCGKEDFHSARWSGRLASGDHPEDPHTRDYY